VKNYEFNITIKGRGSSVDEAFQKALDSLRDDPESVITNEVIYVALSAPSDPDDNEDESSRSIEN